MKETFLNKVEVVRQLGIFAIVCFAIVGWVGLRACVAFFQEAIYHFAPRIAAVGESAGANPAGHG